MPQQNINIKNKKVRFEYEILDKYTAGIVLSGTEIKSIRLGKASITESFCEFNDKGELFIINMQVDEYSHASHFN
ncbi:MAG: SsrA-binding protein, partial [Aurantibacter sp.]